jgi:tetratricopeptide (TPR) repeat protein
MRTTHHLLLALSLVSVTAFAGHKQDAKKHVDKAMKAHAEGKFDVALTELRAAYKLDPQPDLLYAMGQVYSKLGRCTDATESFEKFRKTKKNDATIGKVVDEAIAACKPADTPFSDSHPAEGSTTEPATTEPAKTEPTTTEPAKVETTPAPPVETAPAPPVETAPSPPVETAPPPPAEKPPTAPPGPGHWYGDVVGDALVTGGIVAIVVSGVEYAGARSSVDDASNAMTLDQYNKSLDDAHGKRTVSLILGGAGVALVAGGLVHYMFHGKHAESGVAVVPTAGGGMITWSGGL